MLAFDGPIPDPAIPCQGVTYTLVAAACTQGMSGMCRPKAAGPLATVPRGGCGIAHSSQNLTTIRSWHALTRLDETAQRS